MVESSKFEVLLNKMELRQQMEALQEFVKNCQTKPTLLQKPELAFVRQWLESLDAKIPGASQSSTFSCPVSGFSSFGKTDDDSDFEIDNDGVIPEDRDPNQEMGNEALDVTDEMLNLSDKKKETALIAVSQGRFREAVDHFTRAIKNNPTSDDLYAKRASTFIELQKPNAAIRDCDKAIELNSDSAQAYKWRGKAHRLLGHWVESYNDLAMSCRLDFDEETKEMMREVESRAKKLVAHERKRERRREELLLHQRRERLRQVKEECEKETRVIPTREPEIAAAFADISSNPSTMSQYVDQPKIQDLVTLMHIKFGGPPVTL